MSVAADEARREAREILDGRAYQDTDLPRPLEGPFQRLGELVQDAFGWLTDTLPGGGITAWALIAAALLLFGVWLAARVTRRQVAQQVARAERALTEEQDPRALLRAAEDAERGGDLTLALRLRFRAGLLDLDRRGLLDLRPAMPTGEIARALRSPTFDGLARAFEEVAYGGRAATAQDVAAAREGWPKVREETQGARRAVAA
ncbi:MAG TPA: DUF4129 domain-containing protein [Solirubrobacteraceae bacterium]|nr:DUF4129 domain-containing protein [Solirubrobacteraceae bacterium]